MERKELDLLVEARLRLLDNILEELMQTRNVNEAYTLAEVLVNHFKSEKIEECLFTILSDSRFEGEELPLLRLYGKVFTNQGNFPFMIRKIVDGGAPDAISKEYMSIIVNLGIYLKQDVINQSIQLLNEYNASELNDWQKEVVSFLIDFYENQQRVRDFYISYYINEPE